MQDTFVDRTPTRPIARDNRYLVYIKRELIHKRRVYIQRDYVNND